mmetsp:Transcript_57694/g.158992  ORF Transcript_57694/g.158992 Transcript_57694/m.158992 type:complete len:133 (-) Transcript_57694:699-1097(-)
MNASEDGSQGESTEEAARRPARVVSSASALLRTCLLRANSTDELLNGFHHVMLGAAIVSFCRRRVTSTGEQALAAKETFMFWATIKALVITPAMERGEATSVGSVGRLRLETGATLLNIACMKTATSHRSLP